MSRRDSDLSRRTFLSSAAAGLVSAGLVGASAGRSSAQEGETTSDAPREIITRKLGNTGIELPIVSMGVMNSENPDVLKASYDIGVRHFDTAAYYQQGNNEKMVGAVFKEMGNRDKVVIGTKIFTSNYRDVTKPKDIVAKLASLCDESLQRLQMDHVDILYVHSLKKTGTASHEAVIEGMSKLKEQGKARFIGVTTHTIMDKIIDEAVATGVYDVIETAINFTMADYDELIAAIANAAAKGVGIVAMKTQAGSARRSKVDFGDRYSGSVIATSALKWVLRNPNISTAIPGYTTFEHMNEDFSVAYGLDYTEEEKTLLGEADVKVGMGFCRQCEVCLDSCPRGADVPTLMRTHMYAARYSNFDQARLNLDEIPAGRGIDACRSCGECVVHCVNSVEVARNVAELKLMYA